MPRAKTFKPPRSLARCADMLYETRQKRLAMQKEVDALKKQESTITNHLIDNLPKSDASGIAGKVAQASVVKKEKPTVEDWDRLYKYVSRTKRFDLLQRRLAETAIADLWDDGKEVPGIGRFTALSVSLKKV